MDEETKLKPSVRKRAEEIKAFRCKNLIAEIENPTDIKNIGTVIRNVNALGVEKVYVVDPIASCQMIGRICGSERLFRRHPFQRSNGPL